VFVNNSFESNTDDEQGRESKQDIRAKQRARKLVVQALYQWAMSQTPPYDIEAEFRAIHTMNKVDVAYFSRLLQGVVKNVTQIDTAFIPHLDRELSLLNPVELAILRLGAFELIFCIEIPYRVVLDESVSLARHFGSQDGYKYVNGVLNKMAQGVRPLEIT
jgi:N utilization substance protein B